MAETDQLVRLEAWAEPLLERLAPAARRRLARSIGVDLRRSQQRRVARQENPDGTPYAPRKASPQRTKKGRVKRRAMFAKIRQARHLRVQASGEGAAVGFAGRVARIARIHQEGASDSVSRGGPSVRYPRRELLGFTADDLQRIESILLEQLGGR